MKTLKIMGIAAFLLTTVLAYADPTDNDLLTAVDNGAILSVLSEINISATNQILFQDGSQFEFFAQVSNGEPFCALHAMDSSGRPYDRDIGIPIERKLTLSRHFLYAENKMVRLEFLLIDGGSLYMDCYRGMVRGRSTGIPTIGQFKQAMKGIVRLTYHPPLSL